MSSVYNVLISSVGAKIVMLFGWFVAAKGSQDLDRDFNPGKIFETWKKPHVASKRKNGSSSGSAAADS